MLDIVDGLITIVAGILFIAFVPPAVGNGTPLISFGKWSYFTARESHILKSRVILDDPEKICEHKARLGVSDILAFMKQPRKWLHVLITLTSVCAVHSLSTYGPQILKSSGFGTTNANLLYSVSSYGAMLFNFLLAFSA